MGLAAEHGSQLIELTLIGCIARVGGQSCHRLALRCRGMHMLQAVPVHQPELGSGTDESRLDEVRGSAAGGTHHRDWRRSCTQAGRDGLLGQSGPRMARRCTLQAYRAQQAQREIDIVRQHLPREAALSLRLSQAALAA